MRGTSKKCIRAAYATILATLIVAANAPSASAISAGECVITDNNWGGSSIHNLDNGSSHLNIHVENTGSTTAWGIGFQGDSKIQFVGSEDGFPTSYYKQNQPITGSLEYIKKSIAPGASQDYSLDITPSGNFTDYAPVIYMGNNWGDPVDPHIACTVNLHLSHGSAQPVLPATPNLSGNVTDHATHLTWDAPVSGDDRMIIFKDGVQYNDSITGGGFDFDTGDCDPHTWTIRFSHDGQQSLDSNPVSLAQTGCDTNGGGGGGTTDAPTELTSRDEQIFAWSITFFLTYLIVKQFVYRGNN